MSKHRLRFHFHPDSDILRIRMAETELFMYKARLIGLMTPDGAWKASFPLENMRTRKVLLKRQQACGLDASWVGSKPEEELQTYAYKFWAKAFAEYARDRMTGAI